MRSMVLLGGAMIAACGQEPSECPENISIDISNISLEVYSSVLNGQIGNVATAFPCVAGSGSVTGTVMAGQYNLTFQFAACQLTSTSLVLDGALSHQNNLTTHVETGHSDALAIHGSATGCMADPIDATCVVDWSFAGRDASEVPIGLGSVCGLAFP